MGDDEMADLDELVREIRSAQDLDEALQVLAGALQRGGFEPVIVGLVGIEADGKFRIRGMWSAMPTRLEAGVVISPELTADTKRLANRLLAGRPIRVDLDDDDLGLLGALSKEEGFAGYLVAPVSGPQGVTAVLGLGSASTDALARADLRRVEALADAIGRWILQKPPPRPPSDPSTS